jgi:hypothetical protein
MTGSRDATSCEAARLLSLLIPAPRFGRSDRNIGEPACARRCRRTEARNAARCLSARTRTRTEKGSGSLVRRRGSDTRRRIVPRAERSRGAGSSDRRSADTGLHRPDRHEIIQPIHRTTAAGPRHRGPTAQRLCPAPGRLALAAPICADLRKLATRQRAN